MPQTLEALWNPGLLGLLILLLPLVLPLSVFLVDHLDPHHHWGAVLP